jgi:hypothetical protein
VDLSDVADDLREAGASAAIAQAVNEALAPLAADGGDGPDTGSGVTHL